MIKENKTNIKEYWNCMQFFPKYQCISFLLPEMALRELAEVCFKYSHAMKNTVINCHQSWVQKS